MERLSTILDASIPLRKSGPKIGIDPIIGLIPGIGDALSTLISGYIVIESARLGTSGFTLARMMVNVAADAIIGSIPLFGDLFDFAFKANQRNIAILKSATFSKEHSRAGKRLLGAVIMICVALVLLAGIAVSLVFMLLHALFSSRSL